MNAHERQLTRGPGGRILTNTGAWSPDGEWIVYDTRSDAAGDVFDGQRIELVNIHSGEVRVLYESRHGAFCGVATFHLSTQFTPQLGSALPALALTFVLARLTRGASGFPTPRAA